MRYVDIRGGNREAAVMSKFVHNILDYGWYRYNVTYLIIMYLYLSKYQFRL